MPRKALRSVWYQINGGREIHAVGEILEDNTVKCGTGLGTEFAGYVMRPTSYSARGAARGPAGTEGII